MLTNMTLQGLFVALPGVLLGLTFHEFGHAWVATLFGDDRPSRDGRVTLNPLAHLDPIGTILLLIVGFGWAKPVMVDVGKLRPRVLGDLAVSLAGVTMNFLLAVLSLALSILVARGMLRGLSDPILVQTLFFSYRINLFLMVLNLLPVPPLDGFRVVRYLIPAQFSSVLSVLYRFGPLILIVLFMSGVASSILQPFQRVVNLVVEAVALLIVSPFGS